jgi:hypothetical protein
MYVERSNITSFCALSHNFAVQLHITAPMILSGFRAEDLLRYSAVPARIRFNEPLRSPYQMQVKREVHHEKLSCVRLDGAWFDHGTSKKFNVPQNCPPNLLLKWNRDFVGLKRLAREVAHSPPASAKVRNNLNLCSFCMI